MLPYPRGDLSGLSPEAMQQLIFGKHGEDAFQLKGYHIERELGRGGCGAVYLAKPQQSGAGKVAVKIMLSRAQADTRAVDQFKREMAVIAKLQHPNIVRFLDSGSDEGAFFHLYDVERHALETDIACATSRLRHSGLFDWDFFQRKESRSGQPGWSPRRHGRRGFAHSCGSGWFRPG